MKQGTLPGTVEVWASYWPKAPPGTGQSVRSSQEAAQHNAVEPRDAGKQMRVWNQNDESQKLTGTSASAQSAAKPAGDIALRWKWVERSVWTDRMLMALETGVKGGKWYSAYFDKLDLWRLAGDFQ